ncbi:hypothetical protein F7725_010478 [Dissostichus mawsoni]|uniref:Ig-like domain-containing protein n=1 Tax=Dissostichus mawsoni TaxID=36200 RepID=A0A7J5XNY4_DISMA|nr:hypothetical protein F7725_010476 [Dissostichus mawsoni]KAF3838710.1 hypothetical protein F7725_010478 [Dissostichus mawsoni]
MIYSLLSFNTDGLMSVTIVQLGESATFTCVYPDWEHSNTRVKWYKQSVGFPHYRFNVKHLVNMSSLTILKTIQEDKAMYHCAVTTWSKDEWTSTYLS